MPQLSSFVVEVNQLSHNEIVDKYGHYFLTHYVEDEEMDEQERLEGLFVSVTCNILENDRGKNFLMIKTQSSRREVFVPFISELNSKNLANPIKAAHFSRP